MKDESEKHEIKYCDIGDYLSTQEKLEIIKNNSSIAGVKWKTIQPDDNNDWINQRDEKYQDYISLYENDGESIFNDYTLGVQTGRDWWTTGFSKLETINNSERMIENFNSEIKRLWFEEEPIKKNKFGSLFYKLVRRIKEKISKKRFNTKKRKSDDYNFV
ncbi:TPA: type ISP restriction/modification enzyme [Staphylococcus aureus]